LKILTLRDKGIMRKILLIEKDKLVIEQIRNALRFENFNFIEASNGWEGWELAIGEQPDLIISNIDLPKLSGIQLLKELQKSPLINNIPFILIATHIGDNNQSSFIFFDSKIFKFNELLIGGFDICIKDKIKLRGVSFNKYRRQFPYKGGKYLIQ